MGNPDLGEAEREVNCCVLLRGRDIEREREREIVGDGVRFVHEGEGGEGSGELEGSVCSSRCSQHQGGGRQAWVCPQSGKACDPVGHASLRLPSVPRVCCPGKVVESSF